MKPGPWALRGEGVRHTVQRGRSTACTGQTSGRTLAGGNDTFISEHRPGPKRDSLSQLSRFTLVQLMSRSSALMSPVTTFSMSDRTYPNASVRN